MRIRIRWAAAAAVMLFTFELGAAQAQSRPPLQLPDTVALPNLNLHLPIPTALRPELAQIPSDVQGLRDQANFDIFAWLEFIALNWPADANSCGPLAGATLASDAASPRVWETWKLPEEIFVAQPDSRHPSPWCPQAAAAQRNQATLGQLTPSAAQLISERLAQSGAAQALLEISRAHDLPGIQQAFGGPLVDQNGRFVRYEVRVNFDEFAHIIVNRLWSKAGLASAPAIDMPVGVVGGAVGSIEVKAAWKVLTQAELQGGRFYHIKALLRTGEDSAGRPTTELADVGLIGFHITHKTRSSPQWTWATFEHVDNLTSSLQNPSCHNTSACGATSLCALGCCAQNCQTAACRAGDASCAELRSASPTHLPTQVTRVQDVARMTPVDRDVASVNLAFQRLLAGSVWANYVLISTQWPEQPNVLGGTPAPPFLANVALETFNQGPTAQGSDGAVSYPASDYLPFASTTSSSCMKCHFKATTSDLSQKSDFSFLFTHAQ
jgi:hypothetical protein